MEESDDAVTWLSMVSWEEWAEPVRVDEAYSQSITASTDAADRPEQKSAASMAYFPLEQRVGEEQAEAMARAASL